MAVDALALIRQLEELIAALDRRMPQSERPGEPAIARDAALLRAQAITRLGEVAEGAQCGSEDRAPNSGGPH